MVKNKIGKAAKCSRELFSNTLLKVMRLFHFEENWNSKKMLIIICFLFCGYFLHTHSLYNLKVLVWDPQMSWP